MGLPLNRLLVWGVLMFLAASACAAEAPLRIVTEELPPYNMTQNGRMTGMSTEVVQAVLKEVGMDAPIHSMPWARAYELALNESNVLIYSIVRTLHVNRCSSGSAASARRSGTSTRWQTGR